MVCYGRESYVCKKLAPIASHHPGNEVVARVRPPSPCPPRRRCSCSPDRHRRQNSSCTRPHRAGCSRAHESPDTSTDRQHSTAQPGPARGGGVGGRRQSAQRHSSACTHPSILPRHPLLTSILALSLRSPPFSVQTYCGRCSALV